LRCRTQFSLPTPLHSYLSGRIEELAGALSSLGLFPFSCRDDVEETFGFSCFLSTCLSLLSFPSFSFQSQKKASPRRDIAKQLTPPPPYPPFFFFLFTPATGTARKDADAAVGLGRRASLFLLPSLSFPLPLPNEED